MKKIISAIITVFMLAALTATLIPVGVSAAWSGGVSGSFAGGSGTEDDPYIIITAEDLAYLASIANAGESLMGVHYKLAGDIDISGSNWDPIGNMVSSTNAFRGVFDGAGYTISGLSCEVNANYAGLFGRIESGVVKNLTVTGTKVIGKNYTGGISGYGVSGAQIINCHSNIEKIGGAAAGGIVGRMQGKNSVTNEGNLVIGCTSSSNVYYVGGDQANVFLGGIIGAAGNTTVAYCINTGDITTEQSATKLVLAGGIMGVQGADSSISHLYNCINTGNISAVLYVDATFAGGVVGRAAHIVSYDFPSVTKNCINLGSAITKDQTGAVADGKFGSLVGNVVNYAHFENCYTSVPVTQYDYVGTDNSFATDGAVTVLSREQMTGLSAVENMKLSSAWIADPSGIPSIDVEKALEIYQGEFYVLEEEEETTAPAPGTDPVEVTTPAPEVTTAPTPGTDAPATTSATGGNDGNNDSTGKTSDGPNIFVIGIVVVAVIAVGAIAFIVISENKKKAAK